MAEQIVMRAQAAIELANVLEIGKSALPLTQLLATIAGACRRLAIDQAGDFIKAHVSLPTLQSIVVPPGLTFARLDESRLAALEVFVSDCKPARLLVVHDSRHLPLATRLLPAFMPELLIWPHDTALPDSFLAPPPPAHAARLGLAEHALLCRPGYVALREAVLVRADAAWRQHTNLRQRVFDISELIAVEGCWPLERNKSACWAWTGPQRMTTLLLPPAPAGAMRVTLFLYGAKIPIEPQMLKVFIGTQAIEARYFQNDLKIEIDFINDNAESNAIILRLQHAKLDMTNDGSRPIGVALHKLKYERCP